MVQYDIEEIGTDHPVLLTGNFEACAIARCRQSGPPPWSVEIDCQRLPSYGTKSETCELAWQAGSETAADKVEKTYQARRVTEDAAIGVCAAALAALNEGQISEVTLRGTGVDYWVDDRRAILEISGIEKGAPTELENRHRAKATQLQQGSLFKAGYPGYVFVIDFGWKKSIFSHHPLR